MGFLPKHVYSGTYKIADLRIQIDSLYEQVQSLCADYRTSEPAEIVVRTCASDIERERRLSAETQKAEGLEPCNFSDAYLETLSVYRSIATECIGRSRLLMHGSCIAVDGKAVIFTAKSGTGKSTHVRLWRELFRERAVVVNDDKPILGVGPDGAIAYGTPWDGKHHLSQNVATSLLAVCLLNRGAKNRIQEITAQEALPTLLQQIFLPEEPMMVLQAIGIIGRLCQTIRFYRLECNMDIEAAQVASAAILENSNK